MRISLAWIFLVLIVSLAVGCGGGGGGGAPVFAPNFLLSDVRVDMDAPGNADSSGIRVVVNGQTVYAVWSDSRNGAPDIYFNCSTDGGATWLPADARLDTDAPGAAASVDPSITRTGNVLVVVWEDNRNGENDIYYSRSTDDGVSWAASDSRLDQDVAGASASGDPIVQSDGTNVHVIWEEERNGQRDVYYRRSTNSGSSYGAEQVLNTNGLGTSFSNRPRMAVDGQDIYVAWKDNRNGSSDIYLNASHDGGSSWAASDSRLDSDVAGAAESTDPELDADGLNVYVVWSDTRAVNADIRANRSIDGGTTWLPTDVRVDTDVAGAGASIRPKVRCDGPWLYVVWVDSRNGNSDIRFNRSSNNGGTFEAADMRVNTDGDGTATSEFVQLERSGTNLFVVWQDNRDGANDIRFSYSTDRGVNFAAQDIQCDTHTAGLADSTFPRLATDATSVYVLWADQRDGNNDVYCRSSR